MARPSIALLSVLLLAGCVSTPPGPELFDSAQRALDAAGYGAITTEILPAPAFYYAEDYHQQYLAKNPAGYCGLGGTGVRAR